MGQIVDAFQVVALGFMTEFFIVFSNPAGFGIDLKKLKTKQS